jgi:undecaprenyl-diphosphatase
MMGLLTHLGGARVTLGTALAFMATGGDARRVGLAMLIANAGSHLAVQVLKRLVARARPCDPDGRPLAVVDWPDPYSFPSGHAAAATAVAASLTFAYAWLAPVLLPLATAVAVSRVTLRVHHVTDVVAGGLLGLAGAVGTHALLF